MGNTPFNRNFHIRTEDGFVMINGDQIQSIEVKQLPDKSNGAVIFHLQDGSLRSIDPNLWTKRFIEEMLTTLKSPVEPK